MDRQLELLIAGLHSAEELEDAAGTINLGDLFTREMERLYNEADWQLEVYSGQMDNVILRFWNPSIAQALHTSTDLWVLVDVNDDPFYVPMTTDFSAAMFGSDIDKAVSDV